MFLLSIYKCLDENKLEARRLALQRKTNCMRKPYRNIKRTQSTVNHEGYIFFFTNLVILI